MSARSFFARACASAIACVMLAGCAAAGDSEPATEKQSKPGPSVPGVLVVKGATVGKDGTRRAAARLTKVTPNASAAAKRALSAADVATYVAPTLLGDGTIDDGPDPFEGTPVEVRPIPVEDDPATTSLIEQSAQDLREISTAKWNAWMAAGTRSPWQQGSDATADSMVRVTVETCGGARSVSSGVVVGAETVVTTVHGIENAARRVRVSPAAGSGARIPAMIRYLDIDDDVAVLKVPGLTAPALGFFSGTTTPTMGYAYGVANGGYAGLLRRAPALMSLDVENLTREQADGYGKPITDRDAVTFIAGIDTGFSGGALVATTDSTLRSGWGLQGLIRARVPFRSNTAGIAVPNSVIQQAVSASGALPQWFEQRPGLGCPQWRR